MYWNFKGSLWVEETSVFEEENVQDTDGFQSVSSSCSCILSVKHVTVSRRKWCHIANISSQSVDSVKRSSVQQVRWHTDCFCSDQLKVTLPACSRECVLTGLVLYRCCRLKEDRLTWFFSSHTWAAGQASPLNTSLWMFTCQSRQRRNVLSVT